MINSKSIPPLADIRHRKIAEVISKHKVELDLMGGVCGSYNDGFRLNFVQAMFIAMIIEEKHKRRFVKIDIARCLMVSESMRALKLN